MMLVFPKTIPSQFLSMMNLPRGKLGQDLARVLPLAMEVNQ